jgi:phosphate transport system permease protein
MTDSALATHYQKRKRAERRFRAFGVMSLGIGLLILLCLLGSLFLQGFHGFTRATLSLTIPLHTTTADTTPADTTQPNAQQQMREALLALAPSTVDTEDATTRKALYALVSIGASFAVQDALTQPLSSNRNRHITVSVPTSDVVNQWLKGKLSPAMQKLKLSEVQLQMLDHLKAEGVLSQRLNTDFFTWGDSREPELAGYAVGMIGSLWTILVCLAIALPFGVMTAVYLEEFAPRHWVNDVIEVNINNLAAVPSIVFGLLGLSVYLNLFGLPRSSALVGGMTLALMVLPVVIIATRAALRAVPPSIRDAARGLGASELQVVSHHVVPLALPGIMTGIILSISRALGETAPLLMIGMVAFIADVPTSPIAPATTMPVQIYLWANSPEMGFVEKTAAAILVLLVVLLTLNLIAVWLRSRYERRW